MNRPNDRYLPERYSPNVGIAGVEDSADRARRHATAAENAYQKLARLIAGPLAGLLGDWVRGTFTGPLEDAQENAGEAFYNYAEALTERDERLITAEDGERSATLALVHCAERLQDRWRKSNRPLPDDLAQIVVIAACKSGSDWLFPPGDDRHVHDTDAGGDCQNPACPYHEEMPF